MPGDGEEPSPAWGGSTVTQTAPCARCHLGMPGCLCALAALMASSADQGLCSPSSLCTPGRGMQGSSRLSLASLLLPELPWLLGRGETHLRHPGSPLARSPVFVGTLLGRAVLGEVWLCGHQAGDVGALPLDLCCCLAPGILPGTRNPACSNQCGLGSSFVLWQQAELSSCWPGFIQLDPLLSKGMPKSFWCLWLLHVWGGRAHSSAFCLNSPFIQGLDRKGALPSTSRSSPDLRRETEAQRACTSGTSVTHTHPPLCVHLPTPRAQSTLNNHNFVFFNQKKHHLLNFPGVRKTGKTAEASPVLVGSSFFTL